MCFKFPDKTNYRRIACNFFDSQNTFWSKVDIQFDQIRTSFFINRFLVNTWRCFFFGSIWKSHHICWNCITLENGRINLSYHGQSEIPSIAEMANLMMKCQSYMMSPNIRSCKCKWACLVPGRKEHCGNIRHLNKAKINLSFVTIRVGLDGFKIMFFKYLCYLIPCHIFLNHYCFYHNQEKQDVNSYNAPLSS